VCSLLETMSSAWETTRTRRRRLPKEEARAARGRTLGDHVVGLGLVMCKASVAASRLRVSERTQALAGGTRAKNWFNFIFDCHIRILLIKTNSMIYNMLYKI